MSTEDEVRKVREEVERLENARLRLSEDVVRGRPGAVEEDRRLEGRIRELARWLASDGPEGGRGGEAV